jgi:hypothetical protein
MPFRPKPSYTPQRIAQRLTPQQAAQELLKIRNSLPSKEQQAFDRQIKQEQRNLEQWQDDQDARADAAVYQNQVAILSHAATQAYAAEYRKRNDIWSETNEDGTTTSFVGSLHEDKVGMYRGK